MHLDIASLLFALLINQVTMAIALPAVMGPVGPPARRAQAGAVLQAAGWGALLASGLMPRGSVLDWLLSSLAMVGLSASLAFIAAAFDLWCGRTACSRGPARVAVVLTLGYALGFSSYPFRVGWANGLLALQTLMVAYALARRPAVPIGRWRWLLIVSLLVQIAVTLWRAVLGAFFTETYPRFLTPNVATYTTAIVANATTVLSLIGILLAHRDEAARELERLATVDSLTGVYNRRAWLARASEALSASRRYRHPLAVLMIDLDHFKQINDTRGHETGDRALRVVAAALQAALRAGDVVGRYGGEEFCVLMSHADHAAALAFDARLRERLAAVTPVELGFELSYSAGIAMQHGDDDTLEAMLRRADAMLYRAKAEGRARTLDETGLRLQAA